ncbi:MAG: esterase-like activity of phytase family protein [Sulfurovum sp.]|nr:MAG: esterase-like activity of phytase family protein [Sulfurovum sp.]
MKKFMLIIFTIGHFSACSVKNIGAMPIQYNVQDSIDVLDQTTLIYAQKNGVGFSEISDMAYDSQNQKLYMVGDKGNFYTFDAVFNDFKIQKLSYLNAYKIKGDKDWYDSEGLSFNDKGELIISFESTPQISTISKEGMILKNYELPKSLISTKEYQSANGMFEAVCYHSQYGILTSVEYPLKSKPKDIQTIYALDGKEWNFKASTFTNSGVTAMEVMDDGNILVVERAYSGLKNPMAVTLKKVFLDKCDEKNMCQSKVLGEFNSFSGDGVNNYEGITKVGKNRYLLVSDDANKSFVHTRLLYFSTKE